MSSSSILDQGATLWDGRCPPASPIAPFLLVHRLLVLSLVMRVYRIFVCTCVLSFDRACVIAADCSTEDCYARKGNPAETTGVVFWYHVLFYPKCMHLL